MSSTLTNLTTAVQSLTGRPASDPLLAAANITQALNDAAHVFAIEYPWAWLETEESIATTTGTDTYTVGSAGTYIDTITIGIAGNVPLERMSLAELRRRYPSTASGTPLFFARKGISSLVVRPTPITTVLPTLLHTYHKAETALSAGSDTLLCPVWYEQAITNRAAAELMFRAGDAQRGQIFLARYEDLRNRALEQERRSQGLSVANDEAPSQPRAPLPGKPAAA